MRVGVIAIAAILATALLVAQDQAPQGPVFRGTADLIRLDVSVIDKNHRPIRGLTAADFTVLENGTPQRVVGVSEIDVPPPMAEPRWRAHAAPDVVTAGLAEAIASSRLFAVVMDDATIPENVDGPTVAAARQAARDVVDRLGPGDVAAIVFTGNVRASQDFTTDRGKLYDAISAFDPIGPPITDGALEPPPRRGPVAGPSCARFHPGITTLDTLVQLLARIPERRRTIIHISSGEPVDFSAGVQSCDFDLSEATKTLFRAAHAANVEIDTIDPTGPGGLEIQAFGLWLRPQSREPLHLRAARSRDFVFAEASNTGGLASVVSGDTGVDQIFEATGAFYLVGYQTSNPATDGKYRRIEIRVNRDGATARATAGYNAASALPGANPGAPVDASADLRSVLSGLYANASLPLRVAVAPFAAPDGGSMAVVEIGIAEPAPVQTAHETLTVVAASAESDETPFAMRQDLIPVDVVPGLSSAAQCELVSRIDVAPGRHTLQFRAHSARLDRGATAIVDVEVPDFARAPISLSGVVLTTATAALRSIDPARASLLPAGATTERTFGVGQPVGGFVRVYQGRGAAAGPVEMTLDLIDATDQTVVSTSTTLAVSAFGTDRSADYRFDVPTRGLHQGLHLMRVTGRRPDGTTARRDVVFTVR